MAMVASSWRPADAAGPRALLIFLGNCLIGIFAAAAAVALRAAVHLPPTILPFFTVVVAICLVTVAAGLAGGIVTAVVGGLLTWYLILSPHSWRLGSDEAYTFLGYATVAAVILATSELYRRSERKHQEQALAIARRDSEQQRLFAGEMSHRLKNAIAIVQGIARQTFPRNLPEAVKFEGRLQALADAHNLLMDHVEQPTAPVPLLVERALRPFADEPRRFRLAGPDLHLGAHDVVSVALALHELGTNAVKHGALREPSGWVSVEWRQVGSKMRLEWREHGGPPVCPPSRKGFGTRLLMRAGVGADVQFCADGLQCTITSELAST